MDKFPTIIRSYHKVWVEIEVPHDLWDHEWDGVEYESLDEAKAVMKEAEKDPRVCNAWIESYAVDSEGQTWDFDAEWMKKIAEEKAAAADYHKDETGHCDFGLVGE